MKVPEKRYDPKAIEAKYTEFWRKTKAYERSKKLRSRGKEFFFVDGPPYASGPVHVGTARNKLLKDAMLRFRRMEGMNVRDQPGFDMHGLPIEVQVEKAMGFERKRQIEDGGIDKFVARCRELAESNQRQMAADFTDLGIWMDWSAPYLSSSIDYIESAWWTFKKLHSSELVFNEMRALPWCPRCETALSEQEVRYSTEVGDSIYLKLPLRGKRDEYLLIWTTSPWTILGNLAVAVNPNLSYARVKARKGGKVETMYVLEDNVEALANATGIEAYEIQEAMKGSKLVGLQYFHPLMADVPYLKQAKGEWMHKVIPSDKVTRHNTGLAHVAPGLCMEDFDVAKEHGLPPFSPVDERAIFTTESGLKYAGKTTGEASKQVVADLTSMRFLLLATEAKHRVGKCWRCHSPLVCRTSKQWFVKTSAAREKMMRGTKSVTWMPTYRGTSSIYSHVEKARDWCVSRQRYWGIPVPVWECIADVCGHREVIGSPKELAGKPGYREGMDLHRPSIDGVRLECPKCGGAMKRVSDVLDVWYDASVASWAQLGYPARRDEFKRWWPCDWVTEAHDQVKGWFFVQMAASTLVFDRVPYKSALVHGWICDQSGKPMSKSGENAVSPTQAIDVYGRDALRLYLLGSVPPWKDVKYNPDDLKAAARFLNTLWNVYRFAALYSKIDAYDTTTTYEIVQKHLTPEDRWLLSRLEALKESVASAFHSQAHHKAIAGIEDFVVKDVSRWYLKLVRGRAWAEGAPDDKKALYWTITEALVTLSKVIAPFAPYLAEDIYQNMDGSLVSVHHCDWPVSVKERRDALLEAQMNIARDIVMAANQARQLVGHKLRWPVKRVTVEAKEQRVADAIGTFGKVIMKQANAKEIETVPAGAEWGGLEIQAHPNPNAIGKAYKLWERKIARMLEARPAKKIKADIEKGVYKLGIEGQLIDILPGMVTFTTKLPSNIVKADIKDGSVFVNVEADDEIRAEGVSRDVIRRVQEMRKDIEMDSEDFAIVSISAGDELQSLLERWEDSILAETHSSELSFSVEVEEEYVVEWPIEGQGVVIGLTPVRMKAAVDAFMAVPGMEKGLATALVSAGYQTPEAVSQAPKEEVLKVQGASHAAIRGINDWLATPEDVRSHSETTCPVCDKILAQGAVQCSRCGASLIPGEGGDEGEEELTSALEQTLAKEGDAGTVAERASRLLEVIADLRKPSDGRGSEELTDLAESLVDARQLSGSRASEREASRMGGGASGASNMHQEAQKQPPKPVEEPPEPEEEMTPAMTEFVKAVTEGASVSKPVAKLLYTSGYDTLDKLGAASEDELRKVDKVGKATARKLVESFSKKAKAETQMCSLCNAIVPIDSKKCPRCGTPFEWDDGEQETKRIERQMKTAEALDKRLQTQPEDANLMYSKAMNVLEQGDAAQGEHLLRRVLEVQPDHARARKALDGLASKKTPAPSEQPTAAESPRALEPGETPRQPDLRNSQPSQAPSQTQEAASASQASLPAAPSVHVIVTTQAPAPQPPQAEVQPPAQTLQAAPPTVIVTPAPAVAPTKGEPAKPKDEAEAKGPVDLKDGFTYLLREERSTNAYKLLKRHIESGRKGFCVTRNYPEKIREMYSLGDTPILWLSNVGTKDSVRPKDLEKLSLSLEQFLAKQGGIILLDGLEYLITNNSFITVLRLIQSLRDQVAINRSILIMPVNPDTMSSNELNHLEKEVDQVID